ncbi:MAG: hypothetical protein ACI4MQ_02235 [Candidatus Coproplasma sp.]
MFRKKKFNTKYSPDFKIAVIMDMRNNGISYTATMRKYFPDRPSKDFSFIKRWERIYLEEGAEGLMIERRGRKSTGRPPKKSLDKSVEEDLIAENQRLKEQLQYAQMEIEYLKKLDALVRAEEQEKNKKQ